MLIAVLTAVGLLASTATARTAAAVAGATSGSGLEAATGGGEPAAERAKPGARTPAEAPPERDPVAAEEAYRRAQQAYERGEMLEASRDLKRAYDLDPQPTYLYQRAHALREAGSCRAAIESFEAFFEVTTVPEDRQAAREWIDHCERVLAQEQPEPAAQPDPAVTERTPDQEEQVPVTAAPDRLDRWGLAGLGAGAGVLLGGASLYGASFAVARPRAGEAEDEYEARGRRSQALAVSGITLMAVGGALLLAGGLRLGLARRSSRRTAARLQPALGGVALRF